ncbi:hypothetical protein DPMN_149935 [Dreissena polymorpha]|uniref:Uncharacterized protein n=1 Tax=Dreissena polymorpha TaxID=45954 RepID=A0A9D4FIC2_DREPO|nr:hypothetical protein DPMN_149935 [Dreissena polymorpha]
MIVSAGNTVSSAHLGRHRSLYRQHRTPWSSSQFIPSAPHTLVVIAVYTVSTANHSLYGNEVFSQR